MKKKWMFRRIYLLRMTISMIVTFLLFVFGGHYIPQSIHLLNMVTVDDSHSLEEYINSNTMYARILLDQVSYTEIDFVRGNQMRYQGYLADFDQGFVLFFQPSDITKQGYFILSQQWRNEEQMNTFRTLMVEQISESFSLDRVEVDSLIAPIVFLDARHYIEKNIPIGMAWLFSLFISLLVMLLSYMTLLGRSTNGILRKYQKYIKDESDVIYIGKKWTITESNIIYHWFKFDLFQLKDVYHIETNVDRLTIFFKSQKLCIQASTETIEQLSDLWKLDRTSQSSQ